MVEKERRVVVGFWLRLLSDIIDALILGAFGFLLTIPFRSYFFKLGENGLFLGLLITFLYTGLLQSHIGNGQSLAKKLLNIQVLNFDGTYQSLPKSFFRYSIIALIFYNSWILTALSSILPFLNNSILQSLYVYFIVFLFLGVTILVAIHPLKRGVHDLIANSIVVRKGMFDQEKIASLNNITKIKRAFVVWGSCCLILIVFSVYMVTKQSGSMPLISELTTIQKNLSQNTEFKNISINQSWNSYKNSDGLESKTTSINILPFLEKNKFDNDELKMAEIEKAVKIVVESYSKLNECDYINVQVRTGFNIGISSYYTRESKFFDRAGNLLKQNN